jgi:capsular exopolysaccharide synthesis family protein
MFVESQPDPQSGQMPHNQAIVTATEERLSLMDVWRTVVKQRFVILTVTVICFAGAAFYSFRTKPVYESFARIEINPNNVPKVGLLVEQAATGDTSSTLATEVLVLQSDSVMLQTAQSLNLLDKLRKANHEAGKANQPMASGEMTPSERRALVGMIKGGLAVKIVGGTQMVDIRYRGLDPTLTTAVANKLVDTYIDEDLRSKFDRTMHVSEWLQKQLEDLKQQASDAQRRLVEYQREHNIVGTDETSNLTMQNLGQISGDLETAEADRIVKEARMREFASQDADLVSLTGDNPQVGALRVQLSELEQQRSQLALKFGDKHPRMQELQDQINKVRANLAREVALARRQVRDEYENALQLEQTLSRRLDKQKEEAYDLNEDVSQYMILRHEAELNRDLYDALQMRLKEASVTAGLSATNITVIDRAQVPSIPVAPRKTIAMAAGLFGGFLCGVLIAFMIESIDDRVQTSEEVENVSLLASLATIPHIADAPGRRKQDREEDLGVIPAHARQLITLDSPKSLAGEAYRGLRSSLLLSSIDKPPRIIVITSAFPGEGKTTTAANCAIALAQRGERVLLVDADLRRGSLDRVFGGETDRSIGLSTVLSRPGDRKGIRAPLPELPTLYVLPTGPRPPNPAEMLSSRRMEEQLLQWAKDFDRVVLDTAPILAVSDTQAIATQADSVILVVRAGVTRKRALIRARDLLWRINARVAGVVVNDVDMRLENFYTYRYGMYGYDYGYGYPYAQPYSTTGNEPEDEEKGE